MSKRDSIKARAEAYVYRTLPPDRIVFATTAERLAAVKGYIAGYRAAKRKETKGPEKGEK